MKDRVVRISIAKIACVALVAAVCIAPARAEIDPQQVRDAIDDGTKYLLRQQLDSGAWPDLVGNRGGVTALCTLALLQAGVEPDEEPIEKALNYLRAIKPERTYVVSLQAMVLCAAEPKRDLPLIRRNVRWLESTQNKQGPKSGAWSYGGFNGGGGDSSNSQFAMLALDEAQRAGVPVSENTWRLALGYWQKVQRPAGYFSYVLGDQRPKGSMTCAGIAAMAIATERLNQGDAIVIGDEVRCCGLQQHNTSIERALNWLGRNFAVESNPGHGATAHYYYLYGLERVGRLTARRHIGPHDWYRAGAEFLVGAQQKPGGNWLNEDRNYGEGNPLISTSYALLFLAKGRRPVLLAKLKHGPDDDWNHHRRDVANLTSYVESRWDRSLSWQVIDSQAATAADLLQAPVLFLNGQERPRFTDREVRELREYLDQGGFLFAEACCDGDEFDQGFRELMDRLFPESEYQLDLLPPEHPVWQAEEKVDPEFVRPLWGIALGCRTSVIYSPEGLSCYWELARIGRERELPEKVRREVQAAKSIGINVLAYATNRELKYKDEIPSFIAGERREDTFQRAKIYIAKLRHSGGWNQAPLAIVNLQKTLARELGLRVGGDRRAVAINDERLFDYPLVFMHGRNDFRLSDEEREALRTFVERGGVVLADSICGSEAFTQAFRREMAAVFADRQLQRIPPDHPMFTPAYGGFDLKTVTRREPERTGADGRLEAVERQVRPELEGIDLGDRYGVIFSRWDLSCALERHETLDCRGYRREDAARIAVNLVLYALSE